MATVREIHIGYSGRSKWLKGVFPLTLKQELDEDVARQRAEECDFSEHDFVESLVENLEKKATFPCWYRFFLSEEEARKWTKSPYLYESRL